MQVIPVIDIRHGVVVRAVAGDRANYRPVVSPLFAGCQAHAAVRGLMALHPFSVIYVADLDGIEGRGANAGLVEELAAANPGVTFWIDNGARTDAAVSAMLALPAAVCVVGTETDIAAGEFRRLREAFGQRIVLSLDFRGAVFAGDRAVLDDSSCWPERVIAMTLGRVGGGEGPDFAVLADVLSRGAGRQIFAAGGVRSGVDLGALAALGVAGALVSSGLHAQTITANDLGERSPAE